jgi:hypothetical protein
VDPAIAESHMGPEPMITVGPHQVITPTSLTNIDDGGIAGPAFFDPGPLGSAGARFA